jgi:geranylgeranyl pyrophosphate synthase
MTNLFSPEESLMQSVEARMLEQANGHHPDLQAALKQLVSSGGKRMRPIVVLLSGGMFGVTKDTLITLAAAAELLHTATLVHDDVIDGALLRRGNPTLNAKWSHSATILTGDFLFSSAAELAADTKSIELMRSFARTLTIIVSGEITQIFTSRGLVSRADYFERIYAKTASLFELAASAPVYLTHYGEKEMNAMQNYGRNIGMAFQIIDDVLDFTSDQADIGKPVASDLRQGLVTLPALNFIEDFPKDKDMQAVLKEENPDESIIRRLVESISSSGAIEKALGEAEGFVERGLNEIRKMKSSPERKALENLANYVITRHK